MGLFAPFLLFYKTAFCLIILGSSFKGKQYGKINNG